MIPTVLSAALLVAVKPTQLSLEFADEDADSGRGL